MFSCFGKHDRKLPPNYTKDISPTPDDNATTPPNSKKISKGVNSEKEHAFLRAAHNGNFAKVQESLNLNIDVNSCNSNGLNALHLASKGGHADIVQYLIDNGADISAKTRKNNTAIHIASLAGALDVVKILIKHGSDVNEQSQSGFTPLYMAAQENHVQVVKYLLEFGADINLSTTDNFTPLAVAIQQGHEETVSILLNKANFQNSADISNDLKLPPLHIATRKDDYHAVLLLLHHEDDVLAALTQASSNGFTALHVAAFYDSEKVGRLLLENGAPVDYTSKNNVTALHVAAKWGRLNMVNILLEYNANLRLATRDGIQALHCAALQGHLEICSLLIEHGADCNAKTKNGLVPLHMVAQGNHADLIDFFMKQKSVNVNEISLDFLTPLHISSHCNNILVAQSLLKHGASVNHRALNGFTALHIATKQNHDEFVKILISSSCLIDTQTECGYTALHIAAIIGSEKTVQILVENGSDVNLPDQFERTSFHMATIFSHFEIVVYLLEHGVDINKQIKSGETSLMLAVKLEDKRIVEYLVNAGASLLITDTWGLTALHWAVSVVRENMLNSNCSDTSINEAIEIFDIVLSGCSQYDIDRQTKRGVSSLHLAAECGNLSLVQMLIEKGANINTRTISGITPLHLASKNNNHDVVLFLLESLDKDSLIMSYVCCHWSPMHFASYFGSADALETLINFESDNDLLRERLHQRTPNGNTCLHLAVQQVQVVIVRILLNHDASVLLKNEDGLSVIELAKIVDDENISEMIASAMYDESFLQDDKVVIFQREDFEDEEQLEALFMDCLNELEFFGIGNSSSDKCELQMSIISLLDYATTTDSIRRADMSLKINNSLNRYRNVTLTEIKRKELLVPAQPPSMFSTLSSTTTEMSAFDVEKCNYQRITDLPINSGFLVSFLVDARGGYMQAQRMPQMKIFVPPDAAPSPTRIICHLLRPDSVSTLPGMNDCDGFASRILQIHSSCSRFQKPILIEMPHIAVLRNGDREIVTMKKNFDSEAWKEHSSSINEETLKSEFGSLYESLTPLDQLESSRICRIITTEIPNYFSLVSRFQRDVSMIGPDGGFIESKADKRIKLSFPQGALMKKIQISLEVQNVDSGIINHILGDNHKILVSPIITVEPKRRKFRDLIEIQMGLPKGVTKADVPNLKLLFSISEFTTKWEDVTNSTELTLIDDCVAHSTKISARVWLIYAPGIDDVSELANRIYALHCPTPYIGKFLAFSRRHDQEECQLRCILITDDTADKTLECQESFELIATGPEVEIVNKMQYKIETAGNIVAVMKSDESILFPVQAFCENRITLPIRVRNTDEPFSGKIAFIPGLKSTSKQVVKPITTLDLLVPEYIVDMVGSFRNPDRKHRVKDASAGRFKGCQAIAKTELDIKDVADKIGSDWHHLSEELGLDSNDISLVLNENCTNEEKAFMVLIQWQNNFGRKATGNELNRALRNIGREDVVKSCMGDITFVEDEEEVKSAMEQINGDLKDDSLHVDDLKDDSLIVDDLKDDSLHGDDLKDDSLHGEELIDIAVKDEDAKESHDDSWDEIMSRKDKPVGYNESVDESMIVETGDDWSQCHRDERMSEISDDKSLIIEVAQESDNEQDEHESEIKPIIDPNREHKNIEISSSEKAAAYLTLLNDLDEILPEPVLLNSSNEQNDSREIEVPEEVPVESRPSMSTVPNAIDFDLELNSLDKISPVSASNVYSAPFISDFSKESNRDFFESEHDTEYDAENVKEITPTVDDEVLNPPQKHSVLHEVFESEPQIQTEVEEECEVLPDGSIVNRKITRKKVSRVITEKTTRDIIPGEEEYAEASTHFESPTEVIEFEEELPDGTIVKKTIKSSTFTTSTSSKVVTENEIENNENKHVSIESSMESNETPSGNVSAKPSAKAKKSKNKKKSTKK